jgi:hemerythrin superfamily protein
MNIKETVSRVFRKGRGQNGEENGGGPAQDALELIRSDHREVDALFATALGDDTPAAQRRSAIAKIVQALTVHAEMEEALFYPALRKAGGKDERDSVLEAAEEHGVVKDLIAKIEASAGRDETMNAKVTVLKELVHHHVQEEESEIFDEARRALGKEKLEALGAQMQRFKEQAMRAGRGGGAKAKKAAAAGTPSAKGLSERGSGTARKSAARKNGSAKKGRAKR